MDPRLLLIVAVIAGGAWITEKTGHGVKRVWHKIHPQHQAGKP